jgi:L-threonylcarbamoyladenylate synthase
MLKPEAIIKEGGIGVLKTDTLYGVVGSALSKKAVERIYELKGRDENKPFIILISKIEDLEKFGVPHSHVHENSGILKSLWPGPVSIILSCPDKKFEYLHRGKKSLAFRLPKNPILQKFLKKTGPLVAPSANPQGLLPANSITEAKKYFGDKVDFYITGGTRKGKPSAIIDLTGRNIIIMRQGEKPLKLG